MYISALLSLAKFMRRTQAATIIQKYQRMYVAKKHYRQKKAAALAMQTILRAYMARQKYQAVTYIANGSLINVCTHCSHCPVLHDSSSSLQLFSVAAAGAQGGDHSEARPWLAGSLLVQALPHLRRLPAVLHSQDEGQARAEEAEDRSPLSGALQEAEQRHGEQDHAAAEEN